MDDSAPADADVDDLPPPFHARVCGPREHVKRRRSAVAVLNLESKFLARLHRRELRGACLLLRHAGKARIAQGGDDRQTLVYDGQCP